MEIYISIDGVLRNLIQKFEYHYADNYLNSEIVDHTYFDAETAEPIASTLKQFEYGVNEPIKNDDLFQYFKFQSKEEYETFLYMEYALEIFGHAGISYATVISELNKIIHLNKDHNFTIIGMDEIGKSRPSTLFFLARNGFLGSNIKFISSNDIEKEWKKCDVWITDNMNIINKMPNRKKSYKFNTAFNSFFPYKKSINKLTDIKTKWLLFSEKTTI